MTLDQLNPDVVLAKILDKNVTVQTSVAQSYPIRCYADGQMPNKDLGDEFLSVIWNGAARSRTRPLGCFIGNLALTVYCKALNNMTANRPRIRHILRQCQFKAADSCKDGFHFSIDPSQVITPTTVNTRTGYSVTTINVEWRTTK